MTHYKLQSNWMDSSKERVIGYEGKKVRRMSRRDEKLLLQILLHAIFEGVDNNDMQCYSYLGGLK